MNDTFVFIFIVAVISSIYIAVVMPMRRAFCAEYGMTAVWYIDGCVNNKELKK